MIPTPPTGAGRARTRESPLKRALLFSSGVMAIVVGVFALAYFTSAAAVDYTFTGRGIIRTSSLTDRQFTVYWTHLTPSRAATDHIGRVRTLHLRTAPLYRESASGKLVRVNQAHIPIGQEIDVRGTVKTDEAMHVIRVTLRNPRFTMRGNLWEVDTGNRTLDVAVWSSTLNPSTYYYPTAGLTRFFYNGTQFFNRGKKSTAEDARVRVDDTGLPKPPVRIEGYVYETRREVTSVHLNP